jgi:hypothetical protein
MLEQAPLADEIRIFLEEQSDLTAGADVLATHGVAALASTWTSTFSHPERTALREAAAPFLVATLRADALWSSLTTALAAAEIRHVVFKGPALGAVWQEVLGTETRLYTDLDVLVAPRDLNKAEQVLQDVGLSRSVPSAAEVGFVDGSGAALDLHWLLINDLDVCDRFHLQTEQLFESHVEWDGFRGRLQPEMTLAHAAAHATISDLSKLSAMVDVHAAASLSALDWDGVVRLARAHALTLLLGVALSRIRPWTATEVPDEVLRALGGGSPWRGAGRWIAHRPPHKYVGARWSGGEFYRHTREDTRHSVASLLASVRVNLREQRRLRAAGAGGSS